MAIIKPAPPPAAPVAQPPAAVTSNDPATQQKVKEWITSAPNGLGTGQDGPKRVRKGKKVQITHTLMEAALDEVDALAARCGQTRAGIINLGIAYMLENGVSIGRGNR